VAPSRTPEPTPEQAAAQAPEQAAAQAPAHDPGLPVAPALGADEARPPVGPDPAPGGLKVAAIGFGVGLVFYALVVALSAAGRGSDDYWLLGLFLGLIAVSLVLLVAGVVLVVIRRTRMFGVGLLISIAVGVLVDGGTCIALLQT
jgi:hypothetical protein